MYGIRGATIIWKDPDGWEMKLMTIIHKSLTIIQGQLLCDSLRK
jgi:hypothetical protein